MSSKLKSWFFSTIRNTNSRGKYVNFNDGSEPDEVTFQNLLDTTVLKKADGDYQDQADYVAVNAISNTKFTTADNLPIVENSVDGSITLDVTVATTDSEKIKYKINPHFVSNIEQLYPNRATDVFVSPNNLPRVAINSVGTPIVGQAPLIAGSVQSSFNFIDLYETFTINLNVLTSAFMSHSGVLLSTVLNTLRTDVDAKVSDAELASEVSDLNISIATKAAKVTPVVGIGGNGTKVTVNAEGIVTHVNKANASDLKNDSSVAGSTIRDALNNLSSLASSSSLAIIVPLESNETVSFTALNATKHIVDTTSGSIVATLPLDVTSINGDMVIVSKDSADVNTVTVKNESLDTLIVLRHIDDNALFHFSGGKWSYLGVPSIITQTVTNGITDKVPSEDAVFDAIYNKGLVNSTYWVNAYATEGDFNLEIDAYNIVGYTDLEGSITVILPSLVDKKTIIIEPHRFNDGLTTVDISIPGLQVDGGGLAGTYTEVITEMGQVVTLQCNYYGWHVISHTNQVPDFSPYALLASSISDGDTTHSPDGNAVFDALALKEDLITKNALSTPLVWTSANGVASFQPMPVLGDLTYYLTNTASDVATYYKQTTTPQVALTSLPFASVTNGQLLATFISEPNNPNRLSIPDGQYLNHLHLGKTGGTKDLQVRAEMWETTSAGVDVVKLADLGPSTVLVGSGSTEYIIGYNTVEKTLSAITSRIATKIYAVVSGGGSAPSISIFQGDGSDSRSNLPAPVVDATNYVPYVGALNDVDLGIKKITTTDIVVSGATASTIAHFDATKNIESLPLATYPSLTELSYVKGVTSAIQTQLNARSTAYAIPNYYRVDLNLGDDLTGVAGREDKPYLTIQTVWDLITTGSTSQITIEIVGDFTFTTHALLTSVAKDNVTFLFKGKIVYAVTSTTGSRPLLTFTGANNNITFIVPNYSQTTQGGFIYAEFSSGFRFFIDNMQVLLGVSTSSVNNFGFRCLVGTSESYFQCNSMTVSITGDGSGIVGYRYPFVIENCNYRLNSLKVTGTASVASTSVSLFNSTVKSLFIENLSGDNSYTNITTFNICTSVTCSNIVVNNINISAGGTTTISANRSLFDGTINNLTIMSGSILNYSTITSSAIENINLGHLTINGVLNNNYLEKNINLLGNITKTVANQNNFFMIRLGQNGQVNGNGFKIYHADPTYLGASAVIIVYSSEVATPKAQFINNLTIYNTNIATSGTQAFVPIMYYYSLGTLRCRNLVVSSQIDSNSHANTSFIRPYSETTSYVYRIEGNVATNYLKNVTNLTNDCDIDLINGYRL